MKFGKFSSFVTKIWLLGLTCVLVATACSNEAPEPEPEVSRIEALADEVLAATMERYPSMGTYYSIEGARHDRLFDNSLEALAEWQVRKMPGWLN